MFKSKHFWIQIVLIMLMFGAGWYFYDRLPEVITIHRNINGIADGFQNKSFLTAYFGNFGGYESDSVFWSKKGKISAISKYLWNYPNGYSCNFCILLWGQYSVKSWSKLEYHFFRSVWYMNDAGMYRELFAESKAELFCWYQNSMDFAWWRKLE